MMPAGPPEYHKIFWEQAYVVDIIGPLQIRLEITVEISMIRTRPNVLIYSGGPSVSYRIILAVGMCSKK